MPASDLPSIPYPVNDAWRVRVRARMAELGVTKADLHRRLGVSDATITHLIGEGEGAPTMASKLVPAIHRILGWPPPPTAGDVISENPHINELRAIMEDSSDDELEVLLVAARTIGALRNKR